MAGIFCGSAAVSASDAPYSNVDLSEPSQPFAHLVPAANAREQLPAR